MMLYIYTIRTAAISPISHNMAPAIYAIAICQARPIKGSILQRLFAGKPIEQTLDVATIS